MSDRDTIREALDWVLNGQSVSPLAYERLNDALAALARLEAERDEAIFTRDARGSNIEGARALLDFVAEHPGTPLVVMAQVARERIIAAEERSRLQAEALTAIERGEGPFSTDPLEHASNTIEAMKQIARAALALSEPSVELSTASTYRTPEDHLDDHADWLAPSVETPEETNGC